MSPAQDAFMVLAMLLGVSGFWLSVSTTAIPHLPRFRRARRHIALCAAVSLATSLALLSWVLRA